MKTQKTISNKTASRVFSLIAIILLGIFAFTLNAQTIVVDPVATNITNTGNGYSNDEIIFATFQNRFNNSFVLTPNINGFDYYSWSGFIGKDSDTQQTYATCNNSTLVTIDGDNTSSLLIDWMHTARSTASSEMFYVYAYNFLQLNVKMSVTAGGGYNVGDIITVYYDYDIFASGITKHEANSEDPVHSNNQFFLNGNDELGPSLSFNDPPGLSGWNIKKLTGSFTIAVGAQFDILIKSDICDTIDDPGRGTYNKDKATGWFEGNIRFSLNPYLPPDPTVSRTEFSLDIGSDTERSDPFADGDEVFDPGDAYILKGPPLATGGQNGIKDDKFMFMNDPSPVPNDPTTAAPCGNGQPFNPSSYFDLDGMDNLQTSLANLNYGPGIPSVASFPDELIYRADHFLISYDDDESGSYTQNSYGFGSVPVNSFSPIMYETYGKQNEADEVIAVDFNSLIVPSPFFSLDSLYSESDVHINMSPNPDTNVEDDDDVDALDFYKDENLQGIYYFSPDHEATCFDPINGNVLKGGSIYINGPAGITEVINCSTHLGLNNATDIDAFEFGWLWDNDAGRYGLALLFSVDDDDWLTSVDESGGLDPAMIYYSFLNGSYADFSATPLNDDVDAIALCDHSYNGWVNSSCNQPTSLSASNITDVSAELSWTPGGTETSWNIEYGPAGFVLGTGTLIPGVGDPYLLTGLNPNTTYDFFVQADCGGGSSSTWSGPLSFSTTYSCYYTFNLFDTYGDGWNGATMDIIQFGVVVQTVGTGFTTGNTFTENVSIYDGVAFDVFWNTGGLWPAECGLEIIDPFGTQLYYANPIGSSAVGTILYSGTGNCPFSCLAPTNLTASNITDVSALLTWTPGGNETSWNIEYGPVGFTLGTGTLIPGVGNPYLLTGLTSNTTYEFYVQADCGGGNVSTWSVSYDFTTATCQMLAIPQGWSGISTWLHPQPSDVVSMFAPVVNDLEIIMSMNAYYWPRTNTNTIGNWNAYKGYIIKTLSDVTLQVCGTPVSSTSVNLSAGWNLVPVLSSVNVSAATVFGTLPCLIVAKGIAPGVFWPAYGINTIGDLETGKAYLVYVTCDCTLTYPPSPMNAPAPLPVIVPTVQSPWNDVYRTPNSHLIAIADEFAEQFYGKIIGVFNNAGVCTGYTKMGKEDNVLIVYGDDLTTSALDGMAEGEEMSFKVYDPESKTEITIVPEFDTSLPEWNNEFKTNGLSRIAFKTSIGEVLNDLDISIYPNPAHDIVNITVNEARSNVMQIKIADMTGRILLSENYSTGEQITLNIGHLPKGFYQLIAQFPDSTFTYKLVIN